VKPGQWLISGGWVIGVLCAGATGLSAAQAEPPGVYVDEESRDHGFVSGMPNSVELPPSPPTRPLAQRNESLPLNTDPSSSGTPFPAEPSSAPILVTGEGGHSLLTDYLLGPGDQIRTDIIGYEAFAWAVTQRVVLSDGTLRLPLVGTVVAAGKTLDALEADITELLSRELVSPQVDLSLVSLRPVVVNVSGDVYRPGPVQLGSLTQAQTNIAAGNSLTTTTNTPTLTAALAAAGGIRHTADVRQVVVRRRLATGQIAEYQVDLWRALVGESNLGVLVMSDGDAVYVPQASADTDIDPGLLSRSSIAPTNVRVRVIGDGVVRPGEVQVQPNSSVSGALAAAGGPNADADLGEVRLVRLLANGQVSEQTIDLSNLVDTHQIQDGDVVLVPKRAGLVAIDNFNRAVGPVLAPITGMLGILNLFGLFD